jgi:hypothetical protein
VSSSCNLSVWSQEPPESRELSSYCCRRCVYAVILTYVNYLVDNSISFCETVEQSLVKKAAYQADTGAKKVHANRESPSTQSCLIRCLPHQRIRKSFPPCALSSGGQAVGSTLPATEVTKHVPATNAIACRLPTVPTLQSIKHMNLEAFQSPTTPIVPRP